MPVLFGIVFYTPPTHTDPNWVKGIAKTWETAFFVDYSIQAKSDFAIGKEVTFSEGTVRTIVRLKESVGSLIVFLDGTPLYGNVVGFQKKIKVTMLPSSCKVRYTIMKLFASGGSKENK